MHALRLIKLQELNVEDLWQILCMLTCSAAAVLRLLQQICSTSSFKTGLMWRLDWVWGRSQNCEKRLLASLCLFVSVRQSARNNSAPTGWIFMEFDIWLFFRKSFGKFKFHWSLTRITGTLHEDVGTFVTVYDVFLLRMRNISDKIVEIKCQLDATDDFYCRSYCLLDMFRESLCPSSGAREYYTSGCCLARKPDTQPSAPHHTYNLKTKHQIRQATTTCIILSSSWWWA